MGPWVVSHEAEPSVMRPKVPRVEKPGVQTDLSGSLYLFHGVIDKFHQNIHLKIGFIAILVTSSWRNRPWRMSISFSTGVWRTAILVLKHSNFVSPHEIKTFS